MLTKLTIRNFKQFDEVEIPLDNGMVFIGPNNSGKTSALQALALWREGLLKLSEKMFPRAITGNTPIALMSEKELLAEEDFFNEIREILETPADAPSASQNGRNKPPFPRKRKQRSGVSMSRLELTSLPTPELDMLWCGRKTRKGAQLIRVDIAVEGVNAGREWKCGLEFDTSGGDSFYCRPLRLEEGKDPQRMQVPHLAYATKVAMLPPMSGLSLEEPEHSDKRMKALIGEGRTADVLRNLCYRVWEADDGGWEQLTKKIHALFGVSLFHPFTNPRGAYVLQYSKHGEKTRLDLQSSGRGMQQVILLLAFLQQNPHSALLLDEPDAHLEILRQREIYQTLLEAAKEKESQIIAASHSEVMLDVAASRKSVVAFVGKPHLLAAGRTDEVLKALKEVGFDQYYLAEQKGWALYLESATDLEILRAFAKRLDHPAVDDLVETPPFCKFVVNQPDNARRHFYALREAHPEFVGVLLVDNDVKNLNKNGPLVEMQWRKREAENYLCTRRTLLEFAASYVSDGLWTKTKEERYAMMEKEIQETEHALSRLKKLKPFSAEIKASDDFLKPLFEAMPPPLNLGKVDFYKLVDHIPEDEIDPEVVEKLDAIHAVAMKAKTPQEGSDA